MVNAYSDNNACELDRLISLAERLTDEELITPLSSGWTVSGILAHLAFWDLRAMTLLRKWTQDGIGPSPIDVDIVNEAMREHCTAIAPQASVHLAVSSAVAIDTEIDQLDAETLREVETNGQTVHLDRATHRHMHLDQIEEALAEAAHS